MNSAGPTIESISAITALARKVLQEDGSIRLGTFCMALKRNWSGKKYAALLRPHAPRFAHVSDGQLLELYELILHYLETAHGPLIQRVNGQVWGYAEKYCSHCAPSTESNRARAIDDRARRKAAMNDGHPDATGKIGGFMPESSWSLAATSVERAA